MNGAGKRGLNGRREASRGGCLVRLVVLLVALTAAGALAWMMFLPALVVAQIQARTGFDATVASLSANAFTGRVKIRGLVLTNPATFPAGDFVELRGRPNYIRGPVTAGGLGARRSISARITWVSQ